MTMTLNLKNNTNGMPTVDLNAELFIDIPNELYVSATRKKDTITIQLFKCKACTFQLNCLNALNRLFEKIVNFKLFNKYHFR